MLQNKTHKTLDDIIFEHRNQNYGAYQLRKSYYRHLFIGLCIMFGLCFAAYLFFIIIGRSYFADTSKNTNTITLRELNINNIPKGSLNKASINKAEDAKKSNAKKIETQKIEAITKITPAKPLKINTKATLPKLAPADGQLTNNNSSQQTNNDGGSNGNTGGGSDGNSGSPIINYKKATDKPKFPGCEKFNGIELDNRNNIAAKQEFNRLYLIYTKNLSLTGHPIVAIQFTVDYKGNYTAPKLIQKSNIPALDAAIELIIKEMWKGKKFIPGKYNNESVNVVYNLPIDINTINHF